MSLTEKWNAYQSQQITKNEFIEKMFSVHANLFSYSKWIKNTDVQKIEIRRDQVLITTKYKNASYSGDGPTFYCDGHDHRIAPIEILNFQEYEPEEYNMMVRIIRGLNKPNPIIFDVGANIGFYSLHLAFEFQSSAIHSFEPIPTTYSYLQKNLSLNNRENISTYNFALSNENTEKDFYYYPEGSGNASMADLSERSSVKTFKCQLQTMDDFMSKNGLTPDFIKCDVEGAELLVFQGALKTLKTAKPVIMTEMLRKWAAKFNYHPNEILKLFRELNYSCYTAKQNKLVKILEMTSETSDTNFFFLNNDKHNNLI